MNEVSQNKQVQVQENFVTQSQTSKSKEVKKVDKDQQRLDEYTQKNYKERIKEIEASLRNLKKQAKYVGRRREFKIAKLYERLYKEHLFLLYYYIWKHKPVLKEVKDDHPFKYAINTLKNDDKFKNFKYTDEDFDFVTDCLQDYIDKRFKELDEEKARKQQEQQQ